MQATWLGFMKAQPSLTSGSCKEPGHEKQRPALEALQASRSAGRHLRHTCTCQGMAAHGRGEASQRLQGPKTYRGIGL